jgi:two-component system, response regulator YesN
LKTLIIDDEPHVRETIRMLIPWEVYKIQQVLEAGGGEEAMLIITAEKPQVVFTDIRMPGMSGIELLQWIRHNTPHTKVIVVSGYDDYQYMRSVLQYGGFDYILKPIDAEEITNIFGKAVVSWLEEEEERSQTKEIRKKANQLKPVLADKLLSQLIIEPEQFTAEFTEATKMLKEEYALNSDIKECLIAVIGWELIDARLRSRFTNAMDLLRFAVTNICNEIMQKEQMGVAFQNWHHHDTVLLFYNRLQDVPEMLSQIEKSLYTALRGNFYIGLGHIHVFPEQLTHSYLEAQGALRQRNLMDRTTYIHVYNAGTGIPFTNALSEYEDRLFLALQKDSYSSIRDILTEWVSLAERSSLINVNHLEMWWQEFVIMQSKWIKQAGIGIDQLRMSNDLAFHLPLNEWYEVKLSLWIPRMESILIDTAQILSKSKPNNLVQEIEQYIRVHYCKEIKLHQLAEQFHVSASHLSRTFKQQFGENVTDYIVRLRISRAKLLLMNQEHKISSVANQVGYQDEKYFSKAFKQFEGVSPKEFRTAHRK